MYVWRLSTVGHRLMCPIVFTHIRNEYNSCSRSLYTLNVHYDTRQLQAQPTRLQPQHIHICCIYIFYEVYAYYFSCFMPYTELQHQGMLETNFVVLSLGLSICLSSVLTRKMLTKSYILKNFTCCLDAPGAFLDIFLKCTLFYRLLNKTFNNNIIYQLLRLARSTIKENRKELKQD